MRAAAPVSTRVVKARTAGAVTLASLNIVDLITTRAALLRGAREGNPLADFLLQGGWLTAAKITMSVALLVIATRPPAREPGAVGVAALWAVTALYTFAVAWNVAHLAALPG